LLNAQASNASDQIIHTLPIVSQALRYPHLVLEQLSQVSGSFDQRAKIDPCSYNDLAILISPTKPASAFAGCSKNEPEFLQSTTYSGETPNIEAEFSSLGGNRFPDGTNPAWFKIGSTNPSDEIADIGDVLVAKPEMCPQLFEHVREIERPYVRRQTLMCSGDAHVDTPPAALAKLMFAW
jgi:hypothetical protein